MFFNAQRCIHLCMPCIPSHTKYPTIEMRPQQRAYVVALVVETHADPIPKYNILLMSFELLAPSSSSSSLILRGLCLVFFCPAMLLLWCISLLRLRSGTCTSISISGFNSMIPCAKTGSRS
ncbi:hypothetical protein QR685DRAFT_574586 [Neurospora intermedia]|uniref:Uncharacterized protein n=1 Tax=Neurospora intermedia TaxID=5142 RepID=A0ABR3D375_NEUIN